IDADCPAGELRAELIARAISTLPVDALFPSLIAAEANDGFAVHSPAPRHIVGIARRSAAPPAAIVTPVTILPAQFEAVKIAPARCGRQCAPSRCNRCSGAALRPDARRRVRQEQSVGR